MIIPPLLTLLEDSDPHFRLMGARFLLGCVLDPGSQARGVPGSLLVRTNVVPLLIRALETSFTFTSTGRAHVLLDAALGAARQLVILTTAPILYSRPAVEEEKARRSGAGNGVPHSSIPQDQGKARAEQLSRIISEGIFRVWSFPVRHNPHTSYGLRPPPSQRHDLIRVSFRWLSLIVHGSDDAPDCSAEDTIAPIPRVDILSFASARLLGIVFEFVGGWVEREWMGTWALQAPPPSDKKSALPATDLGLSPDRQQIAASLLSTAEAVFAGAIALLQASASAVAPSSSSDESIADAKKSSFIEPLPPGISTWAGRILLASARLWTLLHDAGLTDWDMPTSNFDEETGPIARAAARTSRTLKRVWAVYHELTPRITELHRQKLLDLDAAVFGHLVT
ncbi:hypothetical protein OC845_004598 [Tilletia horrida]|nr:hypothetical protein OC845_004598 [Tilletia horrida]